MGESFARGPLRGQRQQEAQPLQTPDSEPRGPQLCACGCGAVGSQQVPQSQAVSWVCRSLGGGGDSVSMALGCGGLNEMGVGKAPCEHWFSPPQSLSPRWEFSMRFSVHESECMR